MTTTQQPIHYWFENVRTPGLGIAAVGRSNEYLTRYLFRIELGERVASTFAERKEELGHKGRSWSGR
jgi:hypothetical protein